MFGLITAVVGVLVTLGSILSWGMSIFQRMRTRDRIKVFFSAPIAAMIGAIIATVGYSFAGYGDVPAGYERWFFDVIFGVFGVGVILGIVVRSKGVSSPAIESTELSMMKTCPRCAEKVQGAAQVCRFCGHVFDAP
jgi:hypothetical protein